MFLHGKSGQNSVILHGKSGRNICNGMINRKLDNIIANHYAQQSTALLLSGARQVGKSYAIRKYGQQNYTCFVEVNFIQQPEAI